MRRKAGGELHRPSATAIGAWPMCLHLLAEKRVDQSGAALQGYTECTRVNETPMMMICHLYRSKIKW
jgi:hypothetical protein